MKGDSSAGARVGRAAGRAYKKLGLPPEVGERIADTARGAVWLAGLIFAISIAISLYSLLDAAGYISHTRETLITADSSWLKGESRVCYSVPVEPEYAHGNVWDVTQRVGCDNGPEHNIKVTFHGRTARPEERVRFGVSWKCIRREESFECYALD